MLFSMPQESDPQGGRFVEACLAVCFVCALIDDNNYYLDYIIIICLCVVCFVAGAETPAHPVRTALVASSLI